MKNEVVAGTLQQINLYDAVMWILFVAAVIAAISMATVKIYQFFEKYRKLKNTQDDYKEKIDGHGQDIQDLKAGQSDLYAAMQETNANVQLLMDKFDEMQEKQNEKDRASIKEKLQRLYYQCHAKSSMTQIEKDTIESLIKSYENSGGTNGFVHSVLLPEMYSWEVTQ